YILLYFFMFLKSFAIFSIFCNISKYFGFIVYYLFWFADFFHILFRIILKYFSKICEKIYFAVFRTNQNFCGVFRSRKFFRKFSFIFFADVLLKIQIQIKFKSRYLNQIKFK